MANWVHAARKEGIARWILAPGSSKGRYWRPGAYLSHVLERWEVQLPCLPSPHQRRCYHASVIRLQILKPAGEAIGLPQLGWHVYKHTYRSLLDQTGAPVGVQQKLMRHSTIAATMNVWAMQVWEPFGS